MLGDILDAFPPAPVSLETTPPSTLSTARIHHRYIPLDKSNFLKIDKCDIDELKMEEESCDRVNYYFAMDISQLELLEAPHFIISTVRKQSKEAATTSLHPQPPLVDTIVNWSQYAADGAIHTPLEYPLVNPAYAVPEDQLNADASQTEGMYGEDQHTYTLRVDYLSNIYFVVSVQAPNEDIFKEEMFLNVTMVQNTGTVTSSSDIDSTDSTLL